MPKKKLHIAYDTQQEAQEAMALLGRSTSDWYNRIETAMIPNYSQTLPQGEDFEDTSTEWNFNPNATTGNDAPELTDPSAPNGGSLDNPYMFHRRSGGTNSTSTGPNADHGPGSDEYYAYLEGSGGGAPGKHFVMSRSFPSETHISQATFYYHMYGSGHGSGLSNSYLELQIKPFGSTSWISLDILIEEGTPFEETVTKITGPAQSAASDSYKKAVADLSPYDTSKEFELRFHAQSGNSYLTDMAIDNITYTRPESQQKFMVETDGKGYEILFAHKISQEGDYTAAKQAFIANEYNIDDEEKAINGWTSTWFENETKMSLRKATKEYMESGPQDTAKRQQYIDLGGTKLPLE